MAVGLLDRAYSYTRLEGRALTRKEHRRNGLVAFAVDLHSTTQQDCSALLSLALHVIPLTKHKVGTPALESALAVRTWRHLLCDVLETLPLSGKMSATVR